MLPRYVRTSGSRYALHHPLKPAFQALLACWPDKIQRVASEAADVAFQRGAECRKDMLGRTLFYRSAEARGITAARAVLAKPFIQRAAKCNLDATDDELVALADTKTRRFVDGVSRRTMHRRAQEVADDAKAQLTHATQEVPREFQRLAELVQAGKLLLSAGVSVKCDEDNPDALLARVKCPIFWRRALRKQTQQAGDQLARHLCEVSQHKQIYCADVTVQRRQQQRKRNADTLANITMECEEDGHRATLADLAASGVGNPQVRRSELMTRIAGLEEWAQGEGYQADFWTLTTPTRFHRFHGDGAVNRGWNESTPREASDYLSKVWAKVRAAFHREQIGAIGLRVAEPHHDGTPHWHFLVFIKPEMREKARYYARKYALEMDGDEKGAKRHRFTAKKIDPKRGTAAGYVAKYIAKNIDGFALEQDEHGNKAAEAAERVEAWAATWRIRQFQFFGLRCAPVSLWRELRRLDDLSAICIATESLRLAADAGGFADFIAQQAEAMAVLICERGDGLNRYGEPAAAKPFAIAGASGVVIPVARKRWRVVEVNGAPVGAPSWTGGNNCTPGQGGQIGKGASGGKSNNVAAGKRAFGPSGRSP